MLANSRMNQISKFVDYQVTCIWVLIRIRFSLWWAIFTGNTLCVYLLHTVIRPPLNLNDSLMHPLSHRDSVTVTNFPFLNEVWTVTFVNVWMLKDVECITNVRYSSHQMTRRLGVENTHYFFSDGDVKARMYFNLYIFCAVSAILYFRCTKGHVMYAYRERD